MQRDATKADESKSLDTEDVWLNVVNELNAAEAALKQVERQLNSWQYVVLNYTGFGVQKSKLAADQKALYERVGYLSKRLVELNEERARMARREELAQEEIAATYNLQEQQKHAGEFQLNAARFLRDTTEGMPLDKVYAALTADDKEKILRNADKLTAIISILVEKADQKDLWKVWQVIDKARDIAFEDGRKYIQQSESGKLERDEIKEEKLFISNKKYYAGAKYSITSMLDAMPYMQGLLILYAARDYEKVNWYLERVYALDPKDDESLRGLVYALTADVNAYTTASAKSELSRIPGFSQLPLDTQNELIERQSYVNRLTYDLAFFADKRNKSEDLDALRQLTRDVKRQVRSTIYGNKTMAECRKEAEVIQNKISEREQKVRWLWFKQRLTDKPYISLGMGLGLAWALGGGLPMAALLVGSVAALKAQLETNQIRMSIPDIDESRALAASMLPLAFDDLQQFDALWGRGLRIPIEQTRVEIRSLSEEVQNMFLHGESNLARAMVAPIVALYGMQVIAASLIFIAAGMTLPIVWPIFAVLGVGTVGAITYAAGKSILQNVDLPNTRIYKVASAVVNTIDYFIVQPAKYFFNSVMNWIFKPDKSILVESKLQLNFDLLPEAITALEKMYPGLARQLSEHFKHRGEVLKERIALTNEKKDAGRNIDKDLASLHADYKRLDTDWQSIVANIGDKAGFCKAADSYLDRMYVSERKEFINVATRVAQEAQSNALLFGQDTKLSSIPESKDYNNEWARVQELCDLKTTITTIKASL